jgi:acetyltransferase-like isoleucine patch superfamily enzyme
MSSSNKHWMLGNVGRIMRGFTAKQLMVRVAEEYVWWMLRSLPGFGGVYLRYLFLKLTTRRLDGFCWIGQGCQIFNSYGLSIGRGFATNRNVLIDAIGGIEIGDDTGIGPNCVVLSHEHRMLGTGGYQEAGSYRRRPIKIGSRVWISSNCFIKAGVTLGDGAVIAACSNVLGDVAENERVIGAPARPFFQSLREALAPRGD